MRPWAGYVRVSSVGGRKGDRFHSPDEQARAIKAWAAARSEPLVMLAHELDESGGRADRPILTRAVEAIERGEYRGLVVAYLSRASRSVRHGVEMWERIEKAGGQVVALAENIDASTPAGRLNRNVMLSFAEHELDLHKQRFANLRKGATERGIWQRRQTPTGYAKDPETRKLVPDDRANDVRWAFRERIAGRPLVQIAERLGMTTSGVRQLLANRVYLGELRVGEHVNEQAHPALVDEGLWLSAQSKNLPRPGRRREPSLLAGLVRCAGCSHAMTRGNSGAYPVYQCKRNHALGQCPSPTTIMVHLLDEHVEKVVLAQLALDAEAAGEGAVLDDARAERLAAEKERDSFFQALDAAGVGVAEAAGAIKARQDRVERARGAEAEVLARQRGVERADIIKLWPDLSVRERNHVLRSVLEGVLVARAGKGGTANPNRVRVVEIGAGLLPARGNARLPIAQIALPDADDPSVLGVPSV